MNETSSLAASESPTSSTSGEEGPQVVLVGHPGQALEDPAQVGFGIEPGASHVFHQRVDHGALPAGALPADEQPVAGTELGRTNPVLDQIVVDLRTAVVKSRQQQRPLTVGIS